MEIKSDLGFIDGAIKLHDEVFGETGQTRYNDKQEWLHKINNGGYFIVVVDECAIVKGFTVCDVTAEGEFKIWLVGVDASSRGKGLWSRMYEQIVSFAKEAGREHILLNTFPKKFPVMFLFLQKMNAEIYKKEMVGEFEKVYVRIKI